MLSGLLLWCYHRKQQQMMASGAACQTGSWIGDMDAFRTSMALGRKSLPVLQTGRFGHHPLQIPSVLTVREQSVCLP